MSLKRPKVRSQHTILFKFSLSLSILFLVVIAATYMVVDLVAKDYLITKNKELIDETGSHIVSEISLRIDIAENLTRNLAAAGETLPKDPLLFSKVIPQILNAQENHEFIAGGGVWPEPNAFKLGVKRRSFFWGRDDLGKLRYFDQYNDAAGSGYHNEEWYVPGRYSEQGQCLWSKSYMDPFTLAPMVTCTVALFEQQQFTGNATVDVSLKELKSILREGSAKLDGYAYAIDRNNKFLSFPDETLTKVTNLSNNALTKEYITLDELAAKQPLFKAVADISANINNRFVRSLSADNKQLAEKLALQSLQISPEEAQLIVANMLNLNAQDQQQKSDIISIISKQDFILKEPVNVSVFIMPKTLWKIIVVTPQKVAISSASQVANLILLLLVAILIVAAFFGFIFCRRSLIVPIYQMVQQLQQPIVKTGNNDLLDDHRQDEFGLLAYHFNQSKQALDRNNRDLTLQINERKQAEQQTIWQAR